MLVLLRITVGWHFLYAGLWKLENPGFSSAGFLSQAKGPLGEEFRSLVPDADGRERLNPENWEKHTERIDRYLSRFKEAYELDAEQAAAAEQFAGAREAQVEEYLNENRAAVDEYLHELRRLDAAKEAPDTEMPYKEQRLWDRRVELEAEAGAWLAELDRIYKDFQRDLESVLNPQQRRRPPPMEPVTQVQKLDLLVTYTNLAIGGCLMVGLFTRLASFGGGLFLLSVVLAQPDWPGLYPPPPPSMGRSLLVTKEFVEMMALFALAATPVGRWGGLDFFLHHLIVRPLFGKRET